MLDPQLFDFVLSEDIRNADWQAFSALIRMKSLRFLFFRTRDLIDELQLLVQLLNFLIFKLLSVVIKLVFKG